MNGDALSKLSADARARKASGRFWSVDSFERQLDKALIVYGTIAEADAQREAAQALQRKLAGRWANITVPIKADNDVTDSMIKDCSHPAGRPAGDQSSVGASGQGVAGRLRHGFVHAGGRDLCTSPDGDRRGGPEPAGRRSLGRHLRRPECRGHLDVPQAVSRPRRRRCRGLAHGEWRVDPATGRAGFRRLRQASRRAVP